MNLVASTNRLIAGVMIGFAVVFVAIAGVANYYENQKYWGTTDAQRDAVHEQVFKTVCADWAKLNIWEKYVINRNQTWCSDYLKRL